MIARFAIVVVTLLTTSSAFAETLTAEAARRFVAGKLFAFNCFDGSPVPRRGADETGMAAGGNTAGPGRVRVRVAARDSV